MADAQKYAEWIVANQDKKGTPEFETVSAAYKAARSIPENSAAKPAQPPMAANVYDPTADMSTAQKFAAAVGKGMHDIYSGGKQLIGLTTQEEIDRQKELEKPLMDTTPGTIGAVVGEIAPTLAVPSAATLKGAAATGALIGALQPTGKNESRLFNTALGGVTGTAGGALPKVIARVVNPNAVERVKAMPSNVTPGQALGGAFKTIEEKATSLPIAGSAIQKAQQQSVEDWNKAVINKAIEPLGEKVSEAGHQGIKEAADILSKSYNTLLPKLKVQQDAPFLQQITNVKALGQNLPPERAAQLNSIIDNQVLSKFTDHGLMSGETMKQVDSNLGMLIRGMKGSADFDQRQVGDALRETQAALRSMVERANPEHAPQLAKINDAFAKFIRIERAAGMQGAKEGVFMPSQLKSAARATEAGLRKGRFAKGESLMQDVANQGENVIGSRYPDSGTTGRMLPVMAGAAYLSNPLLAVSEAGLAGAYTSPAIRNALVALAAKRPEQAAKLANALRLTAPSTGRIGAMAPAYIEQQ